MSVVLVIAVGLFFLRDNIAKFINNAATQIAGEESNDSLNEYGFYFDKTYWNEETGIGIIFHEDGSTDAIQGDYTVQMGEPGSNSYSDGTINYSQGTDSVRWEFSPDGKTVTHYNGKNGKFLGTYNLKE